MPALPLGTELDEQPHHQLGLICKIVDKQSLSTAPVIPTLTPPPPLLCLQRPPPPHPSPFGSPHNQIMIFFIINKVYQDVQSQSKQLCSAGMHAHLCLSLLVWFGWKICFQSRIRNNLCGKYKAFCIFWKSVFAAGFNYDKILLPHHNAWLKTLNSFNLAFETMHSSCVKFIIAVCFLFLLKMKWPKNKSLYEVAKTHGLVCWSDGAQFLRSIFKCANGVLTIPFVFSAQSLDFVFRLQSVVRCDVFKNLARSPDIYEQEI